MRTFSLYDGSFVSRQLSATLGGENIHEPPSLLRWSEKDSFALVAFYTDMYVDEIRKYSPYHTVNFAWLLEPPSLSTTHYEKARENSRLYDAVFTFDRNLAESNPSGRFVFSPLGGSWISLDHWGIWHKTRSVSIIGTDKQRAAGHIMRHKAIGVYSGALDIYGRGYNAIATKTIALRDYRYSVVIESCQLDGYFSEKIIDCLCQGTVPIYWGCSDIGDYFPKDSYIPFQSIEELGGILRNVVSNEDYQSRVPALRQALSSCLAYRCAEDNLAVRAAGMI